MVVTRLLLTIRTRLVLRIEVICRVTTTPAALGTKDPKLVWTRVLAPALMVSAELLRTRTPGPPSRVWVTYRCRPRLLEMPALFRLTRALQFVGKVRMNLLVRVSWYVLISLLLAVLGPF